MGIGDVFEENQAVGVSPPPIPSKGSVVRSGLVSMDSGGHFLGLDGWFF